MVKKLPPLSPSVEALLARSRAVAPLPPTVHARVIARAAANVPPQPLFVRAPERRTGMFALAAGLVVALGAAAFAARTWQERTPSSPVSVARGEPVDSTAWANPRPSPSPSMADPPQPVAAATVVPPAPSVPASPRHPKLSPGKATAQPARTPNAELELLRAARQDYSRGEFAGALAAVAEHARRFRNGVLVEEREALRVKSLAGLGRFEESERAAAAFHVRFPQSVLLSAFEHVADARR